MPSDGTAGKPAQLISPFGPVVCVPPQTPTGCGVGNGASRKATTAMIATPVRKV
jgi:hypothetical protein